VTISVATHAGDHFADGLLSRADIVLYAAKNAGWNALRLAA
jgi:GGDEF domain-containing protein